MNRRTFAKGALALGLIPSGIAWADDRMHGDLTHLREEEKLARDLYLDLYDLWGLPSFARIAESEQRHMDRVGEQLLLKGWEDPVRGLGRGEFHDSALQSLYDELVDRGAASEVDALTVAATVEDLDISDLDQARSRADDPALAAVYALLRCGSENHLRAYVGQLRARGMDYAATHLPQSEIDRILAAPSGGCGGGRGHSTRGRGWRGGRG